MFDLELHSKQVYARIYKDMQSAYKYVLKERFSAKDTIQLATSAVWFTHEAYPELEDEDLVKKSVEVLYSDFSPELKALKDARRRSRGRVRAAKHNAADLPSLPWGEGFTPFNAGEPGTFERVGAVCNNEPDLDAQRYEDEVTRVEIKELLSELIKQWGHPDLALAYVLHKAFNYSVPDILRMYGMTLEKLGPKAYMATRKKAWQHLAACDEHAGEALKASIAKLKPYFRKEQNGQV